MDQANPTIHITQDACDWYHNRRTLSKIKDLELEVRELPEEIEKSDFNLKYQVQRAQSYSEDLNLTFVDLSPDAIADGKGPMCKQFAYVIVACRGDYSYN
jgi:hypothetical protein